MIRWGGAARRFAASTASLVASPGAGDAPLQSILREGGCLAAAQQSFQRFGRYSGNEKAWHAVTQQILEQGSEELAKMSPQRLQSLLRVLAEDARVTSGAFWADLTEKVSPVFEVARAEELIEIAGIYTNIQAWQRPVFKATIDKVRAEAAVHWMPPSELVKMLSIFGRAGTGSKDLSRLSTTLFNEMEDRVLEDFGDFEVEDCVALVSSMAHFRAAKVPVMRLLGREKLHGAITAGHLHGQKAAEVCHAYGELGWRHDTVFRGVVEEILREHEALQRARVLREALPPLRYSASDVALVALAMLRLKMYRGNTTWFKWTDRYQEMLDVLVRKLETDLPNMGAEPLSAAAFALGRARRGTVELYKAMYNRMMQLLEGAADAQQPPQDHLERFLHGLVMMGPDRKKELDAEWLMQWLCNNVYTFVLSDFILVNRHLVMLRCHDREYLQMLVPFYCDSERMKQLKKSDIMELTHTYNGARIREEEMPDGLGKHFFWALGRRFQRLQIDSMGRRAPLQRIG